MQIHRRHTTNIQHADEIREKFNHLVVKASKADHKFMKELFRKSAEELEVLKHQFEGHKGAQDLHKIDNKLNAEVIRSYIDFIYYLERPNRKK
jgi:hypothetical protein